MACMKPIPYITLLCVFFLLIGLGIGQASMPRVQEIIKIVEIPPKVALFRLSRGYTVIQTPKECLLLDDSAESET